MKEIVVKTISWRLVSTAPFAAVAYVITGDFTASSQLIALDLIGRSVLYAAHEWAWQHPAFFKDVRNHARVQSRLHQARVQKLLHWHP